MRLACGLPWLAWQESNVREADGVADALHGAAGFGLGFFVAGFEDVPHVLRLRFEFLAARLNGLDPADERIGHERLAVDATDVRGAAFAVDARDRVGIGAV